jgi:DeoR/GlpR family transcriptional regulator of sugar metabolism
MSFWRKNEDEFEEMEQLLAEQPGLTPSELAALLDVSVSTITRRLPSMEEAGILLSEDDHGGLWPFGRRK